MRSIYRYTVPVDDRTHQFTITGDPLYVANTVRNGGDFALEFWAEHDDDAGRADRYFRVVGTGHSLPEGSRYVGTAPRTPEGLVFHLMEMQDDNRNR